MNRCKGRIQSTNNEGTGIFNTPSIIMANTQSQGITLLLWLVGGIYALAAAYLYRVVGLCIPRMDIAGTEIGVPRSGGELNYVCQCT